MIENLVIILLGYLIGSVSPAYFLGKVLKNIDIREVGLKTAGATNVYRNLGVTPAIITAIYDLFKGLIAMLIAYKLGAPEWIIYLAGIFAAIGHIFPFYLGWRGGQGAATLTGILIYFLIVLIQNHFISLENLAILAVILLAIFIITYQKVFLPLLLMPILSVLVLKHLEINLMVIFTEIITIYLFILNIFIARRERIFALKPKTLENIRPWRTALRPLAVVFPITYFYLDKGTLLWIIGIIGGIFLLLDLIRLVSKKVNLFFFERVKKIFKKRERKRFSSITLFLSASFLTILLFPRDIAIIAICFLIFGDIFAKFFGLEYGKFKLWDKTLEGSIAHFAICLVVGYLLWPYVGLSPLVIISGTLSATLAEVLPIGVNDNFIVALTSASTMLIINGWVT